MARTTGSDNPDVTAMRITDDLRQIGSRAYFGGYSQLIEEMVRAELEGMCGNIGKRRLDLFALTNGGCYFASLARNRVHLSCDETGFSGRVSARTAGIVATLFAVELLARKTQCRSLEYLFRQLQEYSIGLACIECVN